MKLNAKVVGIQAVSGSHDGKRRVDIKPEGSYGSIIVPSDDLREDEELVLLVLTKEQAASVFEFADKYDSAAATLLADQLRPDPPVLASEPPPWESGQRRCMFTCKAGDDDDFDHQCLFPFGHTEPHTYSASCILQRVAPQEEITNA